jgi:hypothetical protein
MTKDELEQDNDTWSTLGLAAARVLGKLGEQKKDSEDERSSSVDDQQRALDEDEFLKSGMERIRRFEERAAGVDGARRQRRK